MEWLECQLEEMKLEIKEFFQERESVLQRDRRTIESSTSNVPKITWRAFHSLLGGRQNYTYGRVTVSRLGEKIIVEIRREGEENRTEFAVQISKMGITSWAQGANGDTFEQNMWRVLNTMLDGKDSIQFMSKANPKNIMRLTMNKYSDDTIIAKWLGERHIEMYPFSANPRQHDVYLFATPSPLRYIQ